MKPFFIYTNNTCLYIKNINENEKKIASNIYIYTVNIDTLNNINIFCVDKFGRVIQFLNKDNSFEKRIIGKFFGKVKYIKDLRCVEIDNDFNLFVIEQNIFSNKYYKIHHINIIKNDISKSTKNAFNNILIQNKKIYNLEVIDNNIILEYKSKSKNIYNKLLFNYKLKEWFISDKDDIDEIYNLENDLINYIDTIEYRA